MPCFHFGAGVSFLCLNQFSKAAIKPVSAAVTAVFAVMGSILIPISGSPNPLIFTAHIAAIPAKTAFETNFFKKKFRIKLNIMDPFFYMIWTSRKFLFKFRYNRFVVVQAFVNAGKDVERKAL
jgi:hypothetical protein